VPPDVYSVGRLDYDSEGLLILTNDKSLNHRLFDTALLHEREYWIQVEGKITEEAVLTLQKGIDINIHGKVYHTKKCIATIFNDRPVIAERYSPIRVRKNISLSWIRLIITEGKNRQVRKMTARVGFPTLRLIRYRIEKLTLENLQPGEIRRLTKGEMYNLLNIKK